MTPQLELRAASLGYEGRIVVRELELRIERGSIAPTVLTDGRLAYRCLWQADLAAAFDAGQITGAEELTEQQLADLTPEPEAV